ncbi:MAG TPA: hypothetical protein VKZ80_00630 [Flavobacterium sp.]|nr:hypothetical protein [Flavobacterium sp.]
MKRVIAAVVAVCSFTFIACDDDNDVINEYAGKWIPSKVFINGVEEAYTGHASCGQDYLKINDFASFENEDFKDVENFNPETNEVFLVCESVKGAGSYRIINEEITFYGSALFHGGKIAVNGNELKITTWGDFNNDGEVDEKVTVFFN